MQINVCDSVTVRYCALDSEFDFHLKGYSMLYHDLPVALQLLQFLIMRELCDFVARLILL